VGGGVPSRVGLELLLEGRLLARRLLPLAPRAERHAAPCPPAGEHDRLEVVRVRARARARVRVRVRVRIRVS